MMGADGWLDLDAWRVGKLWVTGDPHLGHDRIRDLCNRPWGSVEEMNRQLIENINSSVRSTGSLIILGDVLLGKFEDSVKLLKEIRAKRILIIPGNHDRFSLAYGHRGAVETRRTKLRLWKEQYEKQRTGITCIEDRMPSGWVARLGGRKVLLSHYPYVGDSGAEDRHRDLRPIDAGLPLIHGHVHQAWREHAGGRMLNVGVDAWNYRPVPETDIVEWLSRVPALRDPRWA